MKISTKSELMETLDTLSDRRSAILFNLFFEGKGVLLNIEKKKYFLSELFNDMKTYAEFSQVSRLIGEIDSYLIEDELYNLVLSADLRLLYGLYFWIVFRCEINLMSEEAFLSVLSGKSGSFYIFLKDEIYDIVLPYKKSYLSQNYARRRAISTEPLIDFKKNVDFLAEKVSEGVDSQVFSSLHIGAQFLSYVDFYSFVSLGLDRAELAEKILLYFDILKSGDYKKNFLQKACDELKRYRFNDELVYFDHKNKKQMDWLYSYILKKISPALGEGFKKEHCKNVHAFLFALIDVLGCLSVEKRLADSDKKILILDVKNRGDFLKSVKLAAYQKNARAGRKNVGKYHLPLTKVSKKQLKELSDIFNKNEYEMLEMVIRDFYERSVLDDKGQKKY